MEAPNVIQVLASGGQASHEENRTCGIVLVLVIEPVIPSSSHRRMLYISLA